MLFTAASPDRQGDHIRLYFSQGDAETAARAGEQVHGVSVHYDGQLRRLTPLGNLYCGIETGWTSPAEYHPDGCLIVRGPLPAALFLAECRA